MTLTQTSDSVRFSATSSLHVAQMLVAIMLLIAACFTYKSIARIDRRPPLVLGEFVGVGGFLFYAIAMMPLLYHRVAVVRSSLLSISTSTSKPTLPARPRARATRQFT